MATERIETLISKEALGQFDELNAKLALSVTGFEKLVARAVEANQALGKSKTFKDVVQGTKEVEEAEKKLAKSKSDLEKQQQKLNTLYTEEAKKLAELKLQQQQRNQALKDEAQLNQAAEGSIKQKQIQLKKLQATYDSLSSSERESAKNGVPLLKSIQDLDTEIKKLEGDTGRFQRNVGNYANAFAGAFGSANNELKKIRDQLKNGDNTAQQLQSLQRQEQILSAITKQLGQEFSSTRQQSRAYQEAVQELGIAFGHQSEIFENFKNHVGEGVDSLNDIRDSIKLAASDTRQLDRLIGAATAIAGGFSIAQGAAGLFGKENEDLQKTLVKIQSVMAILNGLQAVQNELKNKDSILRKLSNFLIKDETKSIQGQVLAQESNAVATDGAAKAVNRFGTAFKAIGIGLLLSLIPLVASAFSSMGSSAKKADKDLEGMGDTAEEIAESAIKLLDDEIKNLNDSMGNTPTAAQKARKALKLLEDEGKKITLFDIGSNPFDVDKIFSLETYKNRLKDIVSITGLTESRITANLKQQAELRKRILEVERLDRLKVIQDQLDSLSERNQQAAKNEADLDKDLNERRLNELKKSFDERKITNENFLSKSKGSLQAILNDELKVIQVNLNQQLAESGANFAKRQQAENDAAKERIIATREFNDKIKEQEDIVLKRRIADAERERKARLSILKIELEDQIRNDELIVSNEQKSFEDRSTALYDSFGKRRNILIAEYREEIKNTQLTNSERISIEKKHASDIEQLTIDYGVRQLELYTGNQRAITEAIEKEQQRRKDVISKGKSDELRDLNNRFLGGKVSVDQFEKEKADIEQKYRLESLQHEIKAAFEKVITTKEGTAARASAEKELSDLTKQYSDDATEHEIENQLRLKELRKQLATEAVETILSLINSQFDTEKNQIQSEMDALDKKKEKDIEVANNSIANEQDKAAAIQTINLRAQAQKEALERRQRQLDVQRARFEKAATISRIIADTAAAVIAALGAKPFTPANIAFATLVGAIGALQLARAIAAPIPKFAEGTTDVPGGPAWVGDAFRKELIVTPDGKLIETPAVPTVMNVPKHSLVFPDVNMLKSGMTVNGQGRLIDNSAYLRELGSMLGGKIDRLNSTIKNKKEIHIKTKAQGRDIIFSSGNNQHNWLNNNLQG